MRFSVVTVLSFAASCYAWAQAADGTWVANNVVHNIRGSNVHEACTRMNTQEFWATGDCAYWVNDRGFISHGRMSPSFPRNRIN
ncbi:hypothetical protein ColLi_00964 [Colletotrichum liriopes]|uniref:Uncharacterized protein n=1 Tax=Colletotrichum liriopes TaxID=708192 RepID=A0AA37GCV5_9PEZI|nr:hypothetical protein ColLi_00964 [Colletotrichum liriopes]